jgi:hypothetical protein
MLAELCELFRVCPQAVPLQDYKTATIELNALGKKSLPARERTFRYLRELYSLDTDDVTFFALRQLWCVDVAAQPLLALLSAIDRDQAFRATAGLILAVKPGQPVTSDDLRSAVQRQYPESYSEATAGKIGRNALSSWTQSGHLATINRSTRVRACAVCRPSAVAFALFLAHRSGSAGQALFDTIYCHLLDRPATVLRDQAFEAAQRGWIDYRELGGIIDVGFKRFHQGAA